MSSSTTARSSGAGSPSRRPHTQVTAAAVLHGTPVAPNAVLERRGALVGLIVTQGFRQILHLAEAWTPGPLFGFMVYEKPEPLTDTRYVREVPERIGADGAIIEPIDEDAVGTAIRELV